MKPLKTVILGEPPEVKEEQFTFSEISSNKLTGEEIGPYDAFFITKENLHQASESKYVNIYLDSTIPFFFISANSHIPFTVKGNEFNESWNWTPGNNYAVGVITAKDKSLKGWGFGLYEVKKLMKT